MKNDGETGKNVLTPEAAELRRRYRRDWTRHNREKVKVYNVNYWNRKAVQQNDEQRDWEDL